MSSRHALVLSSLLLLAARGAAGQTLPLETEEAETGAAGQLVLETGGEATRAQPNFVTGGRRDVWDYPVLRLSWTPAAPVQIDLEWTGRITAASDPDFGTVSDYGDVVLRTKVRFAAERPGRFGVSARFAIALPETNSLKGLGPNTNRVSAQMLFSRHAGVFAVHANAGVSIEDRPLQLHAQSDFLAYGLALTGDVDPRTSLVAEVAGEGVGHGAPGADRHAELRAGLRRRAGPVTIAAAARRGLAPADGRWGASFGVSWTIEPGTRQAP